MRLYLCLVLVCFLMMGSVWSQQNLNQEQRIENLEKVIQQQQQTIQMLQDRLGDVESNQPSKEYTERIIQEYLDRPEVQEQREGITAGYDEGFFVRSADGSLEIKFTGFIQYGVGIFENDSVDKNSFYPAGVYLTTDVFICDDWHARFEVNFAGSDDLFVNKFAAGDFYGTPLLKDAYIEYIGIPEFNVRIGQTHVPFTIEGQYNPNEGMSIWSEPFIARWSHGRDPGFMILGLISDMFEYKLSIHNGDGENRYNFSDDFLMATSMRLYFLKKSENPNTFFHVGFIRSNDDEDPLALGTYGRAGLTTPWSRVLFGGRGAGTTVDVDAVQGWRTGVDWGVRIDIPIGDTNRLRLESEAMYMLWERNFNPAVMTANLVPMGGRLPYMEGWGFLFGAQFWHNFTPEVEDAGMFFMAKFSYSDIDNRDTNDTEVNAGLRFTNPIGQRVYCYTLGLGYAFNKHIQVQANWVMVLIDEHDTYGGPKHIQSDNQPGVKSDVSDDVENAWFVQVTAQF